MYAHTQRYLLRRSLVLHLMKELPPGRFLEIGCGRGDLMPYLWRAGYRGVGLEISPSAAPVAAETAKPFRGLSVVTDSGDVADQRFDYVLALEVLEHIGDDLAALREWKSWARPGGRVIITVPAHMPHWSDADELGGHYRRYERVDLTRLFGSAGISVDCCWRYGFPLTAITVPARRPLYRTRSGSKSRHERTLESSFDSTRTFEAGGQTANIVTNALGRAFHWCQLPFRQTDLGDGYLVCGTAE